MKQFIKEILFVSVVVLSLMWITNQFDGYSFQRIKTEIVYEPIVMERQITVSMGDMGLGYGRSDSKIIGYNVVQKSYGFGIGFTGEDDD